MNAWARDGVAPVAAAAADPRQVRAWLAGHVLLWLLLAVLVGHAPGDNLEQIQWAVHPALGYWKHPPLPTLVLWLSARVLPLGAPLTFLLGALEVAAMLACAWLVGRATLGEAGAARAAVLVTLITYYSFRLHYHNHNTMVLACYAGAVLCTWRAARDGRLRWWLALGACWGAGMLSKYQMVVGIAANAWFLARCAGLRPRQWLGGIAVAGGVAALLFAPHVAWLVQNDFPTFRYASGSLLARLPWFDRPWEVLRFLLQQGWRMAPAIATALIAALLAARRRAPTGGALPVPSPDAARFLRVHAAGPFVLMAIISLAMGSELMGHWGTSFLWLAPLWYAATSAGAWLRAPALPGFLRAAVVAEAFVAAWYVATELARTFAAAAPHP